MPILTICPHCQRKARIAPDTVGKTVRCSGCEQTFVIPRGTGDLLVEWGPIGSGRRVPLIPGQTVTIGRAKDNMLNLLGPLVSRRHATLEWNKTEWRLRDCDSGNGTYVNGERVREIGLTDGCRIVVGDFAIRLALATAGPTEVDTALDAMALEETRAGVTAVTDSAPAGLEIDPHAETATGAVALLPPAEDEAPSPLPHRSIWNRWPVLAVLLIAVIVAVVLLVRSIF